MRAELLGSRRTQYLTVGGAMVGVRFDNVATGAVALRYFHLDHLGSVAVVTHAGSDVAERNSYDPWGKRRYSNGSDDPSGSLDSVTSRGFTGQEHLSEVGLIHFNARLYDPLVGRFTSADSIVPHPGDPQSYNRYAYVRNRPLSATDPSGHYDITVLPPIDVGAPSWSTFNWTSFVASGAGNQAYLAAVYGRIIGAAHYGASILPFAIGNQLQYRQYLSFLRIHGPQLQAAGFFMTRQPNLTPPPEPAPASTIAAGYAMSSNAYNISVGYWAATRLGQFLDFCGVFCDAGAITSASQAFGPAGKFAGKVAGAGASSLRSLANLSAAERAAVIAAESATGAFSPGARLGGDLGIFAERELTVTPKGLDLVRGHLAQFGDVPANTAMLERLEGAMASGQRVTGADAIFYTHEAAEATMMGRGLSYDAAHAASLEKYGVSPFSVYHPDVIRSMPEHFNSNWYKFWGIK